MLDYKSFFFFSLITCFIISKGSINVRTNTSISTSDCIIPYPDVHVSCNVVGEPNVVNTTTVRCYKKNAKGDVYCMKCTERVPLNGAKPEGKKCGFVDQNDQPILVK